MTPPSAPASRAPLGAPLVVAALLVVAAGWAWALGHSVPRADDLLAIDWANAPLDGGWAQHLLALTPQAGIRPATAAIWHLGAQGGQRWAIPVAAAVGALWWLAIVAWVGLARARAGWVGAAWMAALMLASPWFRDLPTWRSWLPTVGATAFVGLALWSFQRGRGALGTGMGLVAIAFKEAAMPGLALATGLVFRRPWTALLLALAAAPSLASFGADADDLRLPGLPGNLWFYVVEVGASVWLPAAAFGAVLATLSAAAPLGVVAPGLVGAASLVAGAVAGWKTRSPWLWVVAATPLLPLIRGTRSPVDLLDGALVCALLVAGALARGDLPRWVGWLALAPAAWSWSASAENRDWQRAQWELAHQVVGELALLPPTALHVSPDAHDGGRFAAYWLLNERGWTAADAPLPRPLCHGLSAAP